MLAPVAGHHAGRAHHRRGRRRRRARRRAARGHRAHLRPARRRRLLSTNDTVLLLASGASEIVPSQDDLDEAVADRVCDDLCAQLQADAEGVTKRHRRSTVTGAASEDDAVVGRPGRRPRQPVQDRDVRQRPQLGPGAGRRRHGTAAAFEPDRTRRRRSTACGSAGAGGAGEHRDGRPDRAATSTSRSTSHAGDGQATDLDHRPVARLRRRELGLQLMSTPADHPTTGEGGGPRRGAALAQALARQDRRGQVRRQRHDRRRRSRPPSPQDIVFLRNCGHPSRRRARRRSADQRHAQAARHRRRVQGRASGSPRRRCIDVVADGAVRSGRPRAGRT